MAARGGMATTATGAIRLLKDPSPVFAVEEAYLALIMTWI
jgi:hypothetical protein